MRTSLRKIQASCVSFQRCVQSRICYWPLPFQRTHDARQVCQFSATCSVRSYVIAVWFAWDKQTQNTSNGISLSLNMNLFVNWPFMEGLLRKQCFSLCWHRVGIVMESCRNRVWFVSDSCRNRSGIVPESYKNRVGIVSYIFPKSPPSEGGVHKFWFLTHMAVVQDQNQRLRWPGGRFMKI